MSNFSCASPYVRLEGDFHLTVSVVPDSFPKEGGDALGWPLGVGVG